MNHLIVFVVVFLAMYCFHMVEEYGPPCGAWAPYGIFGMILVILLVKSHIDNVFGFSLTVTKIPVILGIVSYIGICFIKHIYEKISYRLYCKKKDKENK